MSEKKILVVDDEADLIAYLSALLKDAGYAVVTANNGQVALDQLRAEKPDLVSLDITMPEKSGVRFYRELRSDPDFGSTPVVIVTGVTSTYGGAGGQADFQKFISSRKKIPPPDAFFEKPIDPDAYVEKVAELLGE